MKGALSWIVAAIITAALIGFLHGSIADGLTGGLGGGVTGLFAGCCAGVGFNEAAKIHRGDLCAACGLVGGFVMGVPLGADYFVGVEPGEFAMTAVIAGLAASFGAGSTYRMKAQAE